MSKDSKRTSKCHVSFFTVSGKPKRWTELARRRPFGFLNIILLQIIKKMKGDYLETFKSFQKKSHNAEKTERGDPLVSPGIIFYAEKKDKLPYFISLC